MATKLARATPAGVHTAGIYADMTVDGPEIGTLVVIIDRARNLPNRKAMGKQDPYCAARLGKEAKKTDTDKRGGQTPRWDQELRFTVHDSPDYYRLKVSVFNDDKKTELIGECWLSLDDIVVRGGGQNDLWHNLNCKGRYAGDIRIELTYYDIRPRETKVEERQQPSQVNDVQNVAREGVSGPRQPKQVKRRPLPANPTESPSPSTSHQVTDAQYQMPPRRQHTDPADCYPSFTSVQDNEHSQYHDQVQQDSPPTFDAQPQVQSHAHNGADRPGIPRSFYSTPQLGSTHGPFDASHANFPNMVPVSATTQSQYQEDAQQVTIYPHDNYGPGDRISPGQNTPPLGLPRPQPLRPGNGQKPHHSSPMVPTAHHSQLPLISEYDLTQSHYEEPWTEMDHGISDDFSSPPPLPVHRHSGSRTAPESVHQDSHAHPQAPSQAPTNARNIRSTVSGSPLAQVHNAQADSEYVLSTSPSSLNDNVHSRYHSSPYATPPQSRQIATSIPVRERGLTTPLALVAGLQPGIAAEDLHRLPHEQTSFVQQGDGQYQMSRQQRGPAMASQPQPKPSFTGVSALHDTRGHRNSAPAIGNIQASPDPRTPKRKSVSPQPGLLPAERRHSELPFSPDSFDAFNPNMGSSHTANQTGARYTTPEQARDTAIQHERDSRRGDEPIIGNDGRVIDPSDHLPADTWAPEPEQKTPRKGPEVTLRFKHSPNNAQTLLKNGGAPLSQARPNIMTSPMQTQSAENSPTLAGRTRLQKKSRMGMASQPNSSPIVPTLDTSPAARPHFPRHYASDFPLRERPNPEYASNSPQYGKRSTGGPPPVPSKVPINQEQEDWADGSALSEELRNIDIGVGTGHRARVKRYGF